MDLTIVIGVVVVIAIAYFVLNKKSEDTAPTDAPSTETPSTDAPVDVPSGDSTK
jgi:hypothetical protein